MGEISSKATGMGLSAIAAGTATAAPLVVATKQAMTLESAMADVRKVVNFPTPQAFAQMSDDILEMSTRIPMSAEGIAQIVAAAGRAAVPRKELLGFAEDAAKMGVAFDSTAEEAGTTMAKWRTAFELPQSGVVALADQINALTNSFGGDVGAVTDMVTRIGPLGKVGGLAASQIAAMSQVVERGRGIRSGRHGHQGHDAGAHQGRGGDQIAARCLQIAGPRCRAGRQGHAARRGRHDHRCDEAPSGPAQRHRRAR
jgi:phage-related tail protein